MPFRDLDEAGPTTSPPQTARDVLHEGPPLVKLELAKRAWQQTDLAREACLSESTVQAVVRGRRVSAATALKVVQALERNPPNDRFLTLLNWGSNVRTQPTLPVRAGLSKRLLVPSE